LLELERVERQVAALLRFARREEFHFDAVEVGELARSAGERTRPRLEDAGIALRLSLHDQVIVQADREKLQAGLVNLLENAADALEDSRAGHREVALPLTTRNGSARLTVSDNGPGVPASALPHIFEPFFSLKAKGTGLGLAIAKRTIEAHHGTIGAETTAGGMTVPLALPLAGSVQPATPGVDGAQR